MKNQTSRDRTVLRVTAETDLDIGSSCQITCGEHFKHGTQTEAFLYLGTSNGRIFLFSWNASANSASHPNLSSSNSHSSELDENKPSTEKKFKLLTARSISNESLKAIVTLPESNQVVALAGDLVYLFDVRLMESIHQLGFTRGASAIARRMLTKTRKENAVGIDLMKGELWSESKKFSEEPSSTFFRKISGAGRISRKASRLHPVTSMGHDRSRAQNTYLAIACGNRLLLCEISSAEGRDYQEVSWDKLSSMWMNEFGGANNSRIKEIDGVDGVLTMSWLDNSVIVGTHSGYTLINVMDGNVSPVFCFPDTPGSPLLKCLSMYGEVLLLLDNVGILVDTSGQPSAGSLLFKFQPESVGCCGSYIAVARNGQLGVYHKETGFKVQLLSLDGPEHSIIVDDEEGSFVAVISRSKLNFLQVVPVDDQLKELLRKKNYDEAIFVAEDCVRKGEGNGANERLAVVHAQVGFLRLFDLQFREAVDHFLQSDVMQPSEIFPFIMADPNRWSSLVPRNRYWGLHPPPRPLEEVIDNGLSALQRGSFLQEAGMESSSLSLGQSNLSSLPNRSMLLELAIENVIRYLKVSRNKDLEGPVKEGIDTLLMYLYKALGQKDEMEELASSENFCVVDELESLLEESGHLRTLALLYASKGLIAQSLSVWQTIAQNNLALPIQKPLSYWKIGKHTYSWQEKLAAASEAANLLEESSDHKLVLDHLSWILEMDHNIVVRVLISTKRQIALPPDEVFSSIEPSAIDVHQRYLQWLIEDQGSDDPQFHTLYALLLAKEALDSIDVGTLTKDTGQDASGYIFNAQNYEPENNLNEKVGITVDEVTSKPVRETLQSFLLSSDKYDPLAILDLIKDSDLWTEQAILYRNLGEETLVLQILALKLEDRDAAERYCQELGRPDVYMQLLDMYLDPGEGKEPMYNAALRLLHCHGQSLDPLQVLEALSADMPLHLSSEIISRMLKARAHHLRQGQIVQNLSRALNLDARLSRFEERSRHVQINDETLCDSCHARLGTKLFAMYPNDAVVCYKCFKRSGDNVCPITGRDFQQEPLFKPSWLVRDVESD